VGLFQIESRAQMSSLPRTSPDNLDDLAKQVGIIRPGTVIGKFVNPYIQRKLGREPVTYLHPSFEPFLKRTLGVPLFQEQVMKIGMAAADLTGAEAEELRKAMGGKRTDAILARLKSRLIEGMTTKGIGAKVQTEILRILSTVREFMFPESHAQSFASLAYSSAYTRFHYLAAYLCAMLNNQPMGFYRPSTLISDAKRHGLKFRPIDVQHSNWSCTLEPLDTENQSNQHEPFAVRIGFRYVKGLRQETGLAIEKARERDGPFASEYDLKRRVPSIRKVELALLAKAGAFNWTGEKHDRRTALWRAERAGQSAGPLFENVADEFEIDVSSPLLSMTLDERLVADFFATGFTIGPHPMAYHRAAMNEAGVTKAADLKNVPDGTFVRISGAVIARQRPGTASGFIFISGEDESGISNAIIHPKVYEQNKMTVTHGKFLLIEGLLQNQDGVISVKASDVRVLELGPIDMQSHDFH
jgi:error-prone DNA polymerase